MTSTTSSSEEQAVHARIVGQRAQLAQSSARIAMGAGYACAALVGILWLIFPTYTQLLVLAGDILLFGLVCTLFPLFRKHMPEEAWSRLFLLALLPVIAVFPIVVPEMLQATGFDCFLLIIVAFLLLGANGGLWVSVAFALAFTADLLLLGVIPPLFPPLGEPIGVLFGDTIAVVVLLLAILILRQTQLIQERQSRALQQANIEIERRVAAEQAQREHLQQANQEIGRRMEIEKEHREQLQRLILQVRDAANLQAASAAAILSATTQQASGASEQSAAITQASATIEEVRAIAEQMAHSAQGVADLAQRTTDVSHSGEDAVTDSVSSMQTLKEKVETIASNILSLAEQTQAIGAIIVAVNEIATQSNMLALNAAVEAARAGETGKGFAVVASEVRSLAEQSRTATVQVKEILGEIQHMVNTAVMATEEGMKGADAGVKMTEKAGQAIRQMTESAVESARAAEQIAAAAGQQRTGMEQIAQVIQNIHQVTAQTVAGARQSEQVAEELNRLSGRLRQVVEQYQM